MGRSKNKIEENAVIEVRNIMKKSNKIVSNNINEGDKGQTTDGFLSIYLDNPDKKSNFINNIDIQVKGRTSNNLPSSKNINFQMEIQDIENYKKIGGCIVFYVAFTKDLNKFNVYVKSLLPYEINEILKNGKRSKNGKNIPIKFKLIDKNNSIEIEKICYQFQQDKDRQYSFREKNYTLKDFKDKKGKLELSWLLPSDYKLKTEDMLNENKFVYFIPDGLKGCRIPVGMGELDLVGMEVSNECIKIGDKYYCTKVEIMKQENKIIWKIGYSIIYDETEGNFYANLAGPISNIDKEIVILQNLIKDKNITIGNMKLEFEDENFEIINNQISYAKKLQKICEMLEIDEEIIIDFRDIESVINISLLEKALIKKEKIYFEGQNSKFLHKFKIFNIEISIFAEEDGDNMYQIRNLFEELIDKEKFMDFEYGNGEKVIELKPKFMAFQNSRISGLGTAILSTANIINKYDKLLLTLDEFEKDDINEEILTGFELDFIKEFDRIKDTRILDFAKKVNKFLIEVFGENDINIINMFQIEYRQRKLMKDEIKKLISLKNNTNDEIINASVCILIENKIEYEMIFEQFDEEIREYFKTLPIYNLVRKEN